MWQQPQGQEEEPSEEQQPQQSAWKLLRDDTAKPLHDDPWT
jgi:hypothetical protein